MRVKQGFLYLADLASRLGTEPGKLRPVVVVQTDALNDIDHPSTWILPCTTRLIGDHISRVILPKSIAGNSEDCEVMIDQSRAIDNLKFKKQLGHLPPSIFEEIKEKLRLHADL